MSGNVVEITINAAQVERMAQLFAQAGHKSPQAVARAINHTGDIAKTAMIRTLTYQTGLKRKVIVKAIGKPSRAGVAYTMRTHGGDIRLKFFGARETKAGVSAAPWSQRRTYPGTFMKGGRWGARKTLRMGGGNVFKRTGSAKLPIHIVRSHVFIPKEMTQGATEGVFFGTVAARLPDRLLHELMRAIAP